MKLFPLPKEFQVLDVTLKELDTTFIINEKDHVLFLQKKITLTFTYLKLFRWNYFDWKKSQKKFVFYINVSQKSMSGVTLVLYSTLDSGINIGVRLLTFEKFWREKKKWKWPQCLDWCKKVLKSWCKNF